MIYSIIFVFIWNLCTSDDREDGMVDSDVATLEHTGFPWHECLFDESL